MLVGLSMFLWVPMFVQMTDITEDHKKKAQNNVEKKDSTFTLLDKNQCPTGFTSKSARARIIFKDGTIKKNHSHKN